jgi:O-antigen/teichoic acid export membrane protein
LAEPPPDTFTEQPALAPFEPITLAPSKRAVRLGVIWVAASFGVSLVVRLGSNVLLAYLLDPRAFGLFALTYVFITGLHSFSDVGIRVSIIHSPRGDSQSFLDTAWTIQVIRGFVIWLGACLLAWPVAYLRPEPEPDLLWLLPLIGLCSVIEGFISTKLHLLYRHLRQKRAVAIDFISSTGGTVVMVAWVCVSPSLLALASGPLAASLLTLLFSHLLKGPGNRFHRDPAATHELVHFGRWIFISTIFSYIADQADRFVVGLISVTVLGVYHLANQIATIPSALMSSIARHVFMPLYSRLHEARRDLNPALRMVQMQSGAALVLLIGGLIATGPTAVRCLYDARYEAATWILPLLAIVCLVQILDANAGNLLISTGLPKAYAASNLVKVIALAAFMPLGIGMGGIEGLIVGLLAGETCRYLWSAWVLRRSGLDIFRRDLLFGVAAVALGVGSLAIVQRFGPPLPQTGPRDWPALLTRLGIGAGIVVAVWLVLVGVGWRLGWFHKLPEEADSSRF